MKIPSKVNIGGTVYKVSWRNGLTNPTNNQSCWGYCDYRNRVIALNKDMASGCAEQTFLHEVVHAIHDIWGVEIEEEKMERYTDAMASGIHAFINQNKGVFK